jgi:hypothetical protein
MGFKTALQFDVFTKEVSMLLRGAMTYKVELGNDALGNITRINNALEKLPEHLKGVRLSLEHHRKQSEEARGTRPVSRRGTRPSEQVLRALENKRIFANERCVPARVAPLPSSRKQGRERPGYGLLPALFFCLLRNRFGCLIPQGLSALAPRVYARL